MKNIIEIFEHGSCSSKDKQEFLPVILQPESVFSHLSPVVMLKISYQSFSPPYKCFIWATSWETLFMPYANNKGADQPAHQRSLISAFVVCCLDKYNTSTCCGQNFKTLANLISWAGQFESQLVAHPEDRYSRDVAHIRELIWPDSSTEDHHLKKRAKELNYSQCYHFHILPEKTQMKICAFLNHFSILNVIYHSKLFLGHFGRGQLP